MSLLNSTTSTVSPRNGQVLNFVTGPVLSKALWGKSATERSRIAALLVKHQVAVADLSPAQTARLCEASPVGVSTALGRRSVRGPQQRTIDRAVRTIKKIGAEPIVRALDLITRPAAVPAE